MESSILETIGVEIIGVISPVSICMLLVVVIVYSLSPSNPFSAVPSAPPIRTAANLSSQCLGLMGGSILMSLLQHFSISVDSITFCILLFNFSIVGALSVFSNWIPILLRQGYMVAIGIFVAAWFTRLPEWTTWSVLVALALYDLVVVLAPGGPLKLLVELAQSCDDDLPALVYEARPTVSENGTHRGRSMDLLVGGVSDSASVEMQTLSNSNGNRNEGENSESPSTPARNFGRVEGVGSSDESERSPSVPVIRERRSTSSASSKYSTVVGNRESDDIVDEERSPLVEMLGMGSERELIRRGCS